MLRFLQNMSTWKFIIPLILLFILFSFFIFPEYQSRMSVVAGEHIEPLDTRFSYPAEEVHQLLGKLGTEGRDIYKFVTGRIDMIYPVIYGLMLMLMLSLLARKLTVPGSRLALTALLPLCGMIFDYMENLNILRLLSKYPNITHDQVSLAQTFTRIKHVFLLLSVALVLILALLLAVKKLRFNKEKQATTGHYN